MSVVHRANQINTLKKSTYHHAHVFPTVKDNLSFTGKYRKWDQHIIQNGNFYGKTGNLVSLEGEKNQQIQGIQSVQLIGDYFFSDGPINVYVVKRPHCCGGAEKVILIFSEYSAQNGALTNTLKAIDLYHPGNGDLTIPAVYFPDTNPVQFNIDNIIYNSVTDQIYILYKNGNLFAGSVIASPGPSVLTEDASLGFATWTLVTPYTDGILWNPSSYSVQEINY